MFELLSHQFMQNALAAGVLASIACGIIGTLVVVNRIVFLAGGVAHAAYGGVGIAFWLGVPVIPATVGFTLAASLGMGALTYHRNERTDTLVGVLWAAGMALGILLVDLTPGYNVDLMSFLFGSILAVPSRELWLMAGVDAVILAAVFYWYKDFIAFSFDREFARTTGVRVAFIHYLLIGLVALSVVMIIRVVGLILVIALLTIPPHLAETHSRSLSAMMVRAVLYSLAFCLAGLTLSYVWDTTSGATIIAVATAFFLGQRLLARLLRKRNSMRNASAPEKP
ncbi:MAG: metal ABC transporter permease [Oceanidesulfovibrio sp.]